MRLVVAKCNKSEEVNYVVNSLPLCLSMILASSRTRLVDDTKHLQMGETAIANKEGDLSLPATLDLTEFSNRELISYENASVNVDNSTDVIIGPVTQFNVNGNVTIVQNGTGEDILEEINEKKKADPTYAKGKRNWNKENKL